MGFLPASSIMGVKQHRKVLCKSKVPYKCEALLLFLLLTDQALLQDTKYAKLKEL